MPTMVGVPDLDGVLVGPVYVTCSVGDLLLSPGDPYSGLSWAMGGM